MARGSEKSSTKSIRRANAAKPKLLQPSAKERGITTVESLEQRRFLTVAAQAVANAYVSDLPFTVVANGWGTAQADHNIVGGALTLGGVTYAKGLGVHATSDVRVNLGGNYSRFVASAGLDDETAGNGSVDFQVWADGVKLYDSGLVTGGQAARSVSVDVTGRQQLQLVVTDGGDNYYWDHSDWAGAMLLATP